MEEEWGQNRDGASRNSLTGRKREGNPGAATKDVSLSI